MKRKNWLQKDKKRPGDYLLSRKSSTIGVRGLDFRVRDGNGYFHSAMVTRSTKCGYTRLDILSYISFSINETIGIESIIWSSHSDD